MKIVYILIVVLLLFMPISFQNSQANSKESLIPLYQIPITITNSQNFSTPDPFQQMIKLNESNYKGIIIYNGNFANFEFSYENGTVIPAWIESNNSGILLIWVKLISILALSFLTIYLDIFSLNDNLLNSSGKIGIGEAPQLSTIYGEYDDGANVFNLYFNGNTPTSDFVTGGGDTVTQQTGVTLPNGATGNVLRFTTGSSEAVTTVDMFTATSLQNSPNYYISETSFQSDGSSTDMEWGLVQNSGTATSDNAIFVGTQNGGYYFSEGYLLDGSRYPAINPQGYTTTFWRYSSLIYNSSSNYYGYIAPQLYSTNGGYSGTVSANPIASISPLYWGWWGNIGAAGHWTQFNWVRVRAYPPNGVMPYVSFGSIIKIPIENAKINIHTQIYALNISLPSSWGIYGYFNYSLYGKNYTIDISNITDKYFIDLNMSYGILIYNNTTLYYNLTLYAYKLQDYIALNLINLKGKLNITTVKSNYNLTLNSSALKFENVNNFYYFWNAYGYKVIGSVLIIGLFLFFISRLRRVR